MSESVPIRCSLLIDLAVVVALLSVATVGTMRLSARRAVQKLSAPAGEILNRIRRAVEESTDNAPAEDDRKIILIKRTE